MTRRSIRFLRVMLAALLLALLLLLVFGTTSPALRAQSIQRHLATGSAFQPQGVLPPATPTATPSPTSQGTIFGGRGPNGSCSNPVGGGSFAAMLQQDFRWGTDHLSPRYRHDTLDRLCNDFWAWFNPAGQDVPARQVLSTLRWPTDLFARPWLDGVIHVGWMPIAFPTTPTPVCPGDQNCGVSTDNPACLVPLIFGQTWNICDPVRAVINAIANAISQGFKSASTQVTFLWQTPLQPFEDEKAAHLLSFWNASWSIVLLCLAAVVAWGALRSMVGSVISWLSYAQVIELLPRLIFALLAALLSRQFFVLLIQANNALSSHFSPTLLQMIIGRPNPGIKLGLVQILFGGMGYALMVEEAGRLGMLFVLFAASPILFFFAALPETQRWALGAAQAAILLTFLQAIQAFILDVGNLLFSSVQVGSQSNLTLLYTLVAIALLYLALVVFFALIRIAFGTSGYWIAGFPLLAGAALRWGMRGAWRSLVRASVPGPNHLVMPGDNAVRNSTRFGQGRSAASVGQRNTSARTGGNEPPRWGGRGKGGGKPGGGPHPGNGGGPRPGPGQTGTPAPQASPHPTRPLGSGNIPPTRTAPPRSTPRVPHPQPPGTPLAQVPRRGRGAAVPRPSVPNPHSSPSATRRASKERSNKTP